MDIVAACRAFVSVSDRGSFTVGAAAAGMQQSVASRRIAALEAHLGEALFDRSTRRPQLTPFGRGVLGAARQVTAAAGELEAQARRSRASVLRIAVPEDCAPTAVGAFIAASRGSGVAVETMSGDPDARADAFGSGAVQAAVLLAPREEARWSVPLGVASAHGAPGPFFLASIRPSRSDTAAPTRLLYAAEDDVPAIRDPLTALRDAHALLPRQLQSAGPLPGTIADVLAGDLLLSTQARATELGLSWSPLADLDLVRGYGLVSDEPDLLGRLGPRAARALAHALGEDRS